jgi:CelD/BcsL family acetyltransferase involved in cellulose biosynthesis
MSLYNQASQIASRETAELRHEIRRIEDLDALKIMRDDWDKLVNVAEYSLLCMTYSYCELAAALALDEGALIEVVLIYDHLDLVAIWPFAIRRRGPLRFARALTCGNYEEYGRPLIRGVASRPILAEIVRAIMKIHADLLQVARIEDGSMLHDSLQSVAQGLLLGLTNAPSPGYSIKLGAFARWDDFAAALPTPMRANIRRRLKLLSADGHVEVGWCRTVDDAESVITWLFANKRRWAETRHKDAKWLVDDKVRDFYIALAHRLDLSGNPLVAFVKVNNVPVAASVNAVGRRVIEFNITTYDEAFSRFSVGTLLIEFLVKWAHANQLDFDFRLLQADYKSRWANQTTCHRSVILFLSVRGRLLEVPLLARRILWRLFSRS